MNIIIAGSRSFNDYDLLEEKMNEFLSELKISTSEINHIVSRNSVSEQTNLENVGQNNVIFQYCQCQQIGINFGRAARVIKEMQKWQKKHMFVCFFGIGNSKGTKGMLKEALKKGLLVKLTMFKDNGDKNKI